MSSVWLEKKEHKDTNWDYSNWTQNWTQIVNLSWIHYFLLLHRYLLKRFIIWISTSVVCYFYLFIYLCSLNIWNVQFLFLFSFWKKIPKFVKVTGRHFFLTWQDIFGLHVIAHIWIKSFHLKITKLFWLINFGRCCSDNESSLNSFNSVNY